MLNPTGDKICDSKWFERRQSSLYTVAGSRRKYGHSNSAVELPFPTMFGNGIWHKSFRTLTLSVLSVTTHTQHPPLSSFTVQAHCVSFGSHIEIGPMLLKIHFRTPHLHTDRRSELYCTLHVPPYKTLGLGPRPNQARQHKQTSRRALPWDKSWWRRCGRSAPRVPRTERRKTTSTGGR